MENYNYFSTADTNNFIFIRFPRKILKDKTFKDISLEAKVLYTLMLERTYISKANNWIDNNNRIYIKYTITEMASDLGCSEGTCYKALKELEAVNGNKLIERKRIGLGQPNVIYLKNIFTSDDCYDAKITDEHIPNDEKNESNEKTVTTTSSDSDINQGVQEPEHKTDISCKNTNEINDDFCSFKRDSSRPLNIKCQELQKIDTNNNNSNNIFYNKQSIYLSKYTNTLSDTDKIDMIDIHKTEEYIDLIKNNIDYYCFEDLPEKDRIIYESLYNVIIDVVCSTAKSFCIGKCEYPASVVKSRFTKLNFLHLQYVKECISSYAGRIGNIKAYMLSSLYNAPATMDIYYTQKVNSEFFV